MVKIIIFTFVFIVSGIGNPLHSQFEHSFVFLNLKRNIPSNFTNIEWQLGNDEMHFFTMNAGYHFSSFSSEIHSPYLTNTPDLTTDFVFSEYISKKNGINAGLGYQYYFKHIENEKKMIPVVGFDLNWYRMRDRFTLEYTDQFSGSISESDKENIVQTFSSAFQGGFIRTSDKFFFKFILVAEFFLPKNTTFYLPSDDYNPKSSRKLPFNGFEPGIQIGMGLKIF